MITIFAFDITEFPHDSIEPLANRLDDPTAVHRYRKIEDQIRSLSGKLMVSKIVAEIFHTPPLMPRFEKNLYGKPFISVPGHEFEFNLSHSGKWVVCAIDRNPVGVDIERIARPELGIAERFFTAEENAYINQDLDPNVVQRRFYEVWTAKESYVKAIGSGLSVSLQSFSTVQGGELVSSLPGEGAVWYFTRFNLDHEYSLTLCASSHASTMKVRYLTIEELLSA